MEQLEKMNYKEKAKRIIQLVNFIVDKSLICSKYYGRLTKEELLKIKEKQTFFGNIDYEKIPKVQKKFIKFEEYNNNEVYYNILCCLLLNKINYYFEEKSDYLILFKSYNEAYYFKKYIKYISLVIEKNPDIIKDDIIKEKIFEIISCLCSDDKLYSQDFYFYISLYHIHNHYQIDNNLIPKFKTFGDKFVEKMIIENILSKILSVKINLINDLNIFVQYMNSNDIIKKMLLDIYNVILSKKIKDEVNDFENMNWNIYDNTEIKFINYLNNNLNNIDVKNFKVLLENDSSLKELFDFYYTNKMESFLNLSNEEKYIIINSYDDNTKNFHIYCTEFYNLKKSYDEGMKKENILNDELKEIIESKEFYEEIEKILKSPKLINYCKNPIQYKIDKNILITYNEREEEMKIFNDKNSDKIISKFTSEINNNEDLPFPDLMSITDEEINEISKKEQNDNILLEKENNISNEDNVFKCQLELDYEFFINNIFNSNFLKERIIYSFIPYNMKALVSNIPKIVVNVCGNNITSFKYEKNTVEYKRMLKALYVYVIIHEIIHYIRRINPIKKVKNEYEYTPKTKNIDYEGGRSFIYHIFGQFMINYIDLSFADTILNINSWGDNNDSLKNEYLKLQSIGNEEIENQMLKNGGIRCYDSSAEDDKYMYEEEDYYCC